PPHGSLVVVGRFCLQNPFGAHKVILADIVRSKTAREAGQTLTGETKNRADHFRYFFEPGIVRAGSHSGDFGRFGTEQIPGRVDAVDADVEERSPSGLVFYTDVIGLYLHAKERVEGAE